jgi:PHP family Zn ribbon phosphoesterase
MWRTARRLLWCSHCKRCEFAEDAGPWFWRCTECYGLVAKVLGVVDAVSDSDATGE